MLITCPTCASEYRIEAGKVGMDGRSVRCAACRETWFVTPADVLAAHAADLDQAEDSADPASDAAWAEATAAVRPDEHGSDAVSPGPNRPRRPASARATPRLGRRAGALSPALALGLAALAAMPLACLARASVVQALPQTASLYARLGLPVNVRGLEIRDVAAFRNPAEDGRPAELIVEGDLVGVGRSDMSVPALSVEIRDAGGATVRSFTAASPRAVLGPGETARFRASLVDPPSTSRAVELRFADAAPAARLRIGSAEH